MHWQPTRSLCASTPFSGLWIPNWAVSRRFLFKVVAKKSVEEIEDETLILADQAEKAVAQLREATKELLQSKLAESKADELARLLSEGTWTHDYPITYERTKSLGLPVSSNMPDDILKLMSLFPQPVRAQPTVQYLPWPRTRRSTPPTPSGNG